MTNSSQSTLTQRLLATLLIGLLSFSVQTAWAEELAAPELSHESGFYPEEFELTITHPDPSVKIYYTLDGSDPDPANLGGTTFRYKNEYAQPPATKPTGEFLTQEYKTYVYERPILIKDRTYEPDRLSQISTTFDAKPDYFPTPETKDNWKNKIKKITNEIIISCNKIINKLIRHFKKYILSEKDAINGKHEYIELFSLDYAENPKYLYKGTALRAVFIGRNIRIKKEITRIYFIGEREKFSLPIVNITVPNKKLFDYKEGVFVAGIDYDDWIEKHTKDKENDGRTPANWKRKGDNIQAYFNFFESSKYPVISQSVDMRVNGGGSRLRRNKALRIYPRAIYNKEGIKHNIFKDKLDLGKARIILRNAGDHNSSSYLADAAIQRAMGSLNFGVQRYRPLVTFINGEYNGILNARDRTDKFYLHDYFKLPSKKIDLIENNKAVKEGDITHWEHTLNFVKDTPKNTDNFLSDLKNLIDIESFIDYQSTEIFIDNRDWPGNNIRYWRYSGSKKHPITEQGYTDGRWRWLLFDTDRTAANRYSKYNNLLHATGVNGKHGHNPDWSTFMLRTLLENPEFKQRFITRFADLLNSTFQSKRMVAIIRDTEAGIEQEMPRHIERWSSPKSMEYWRESVDKLVSFFDQRPAYQWQHLQEFFELDDFYSVQVDIAQQGEGKVKLNTLTLGDDPTQDYDVTDTPLFFPWSGQYFQNLPLTLEALPEEGYTFSHWAVSGLELTEDQKQQQTLVLKPQSNLKIKAVMVKATKLHPPKSSIIQPLSI